MLSSSKLIYTEIHYLQFNDLYKDQPIHIINNLNDIIEVSKPVSVELVFKCVNVCRYVPLIEELNKLRLKYL